MERGAQVTIFIIVGIIIISAVVLFLIFRSDVISDITGSGREANPKSFLEVCLEDKINEGVRIISEHGGSINPVLYRTFKFSDEDKYTNISYLCYTQNYYVPCVNQEPMLMNHIKKEIQDYIAVDVASCFDELKGSLENQGYLLSGPGYSGEFDVGLTEKKIIINIDGELTLTKSGETIRQEGFKIIIPSRLYETAFVVQEIVSQEARFCKFDYLNYMQNYPEFKIIPFSVEDIEIYRVKHKDSPYFFKFVIKCNPENILR